MAVGISVQNAKTITVKHKHFPADKSCHEFHIVEIEAVTEDGSKTTISLFTTVEPTKVVEAFGLIANAEPTIVHDERPKVVEAVVD